MTSSPLTLVIGATGKTGSRVADRLEARGAAVRRASRSGEDVRFDWSDSGTYGPALAHVERIYLLGPVMETTFARSVSAFLDRAEAVGAQHVTYLSMYDVNAMPTDTANGAVERDLQGRAALTHTILRPAWFMQNFSESFLRPLNGEIAVPTGSGKEAFVDVDDIASVAAASLLDPAAHHGAVYPITGPEALSIAAAAAAIGKATGATITHRDIDRDAWVTGMVASGVPTGYGEVVRALSETIASGAGAQPTDVVERVTGTPPRSFEEFVRESVTAWLSTEAL